MLYRTRQGEEVNLARLSAKERILIEQLKQEYRSATSWASFQGRTAHAVIETAQSANGNDWRVHPLYNPRIS